MSALEYRDVEDFKKPPAMTIHDMEWEWATVEWKPPFGRDWRVSFRRNQFEGNYVDITFRMGNTYVPFGSDTDIGIQSPLPFFYDAEAFHEWMLWRLMRLGIHEVAEGYRRNGKPFRDPHDPRWWSEDD